MAAELKTNESEAKINRGMLGNTAAIIQARDDHSLSQVMTMEIRGQFWMYF